MNVSLEFALFVLPPPPFHLSSNLNEVLQLLQMRSYQSTQTRLSLRRDAFLQGDSAAAHPFQPPQKGLITLLT